MRPDERRWTLLRTFYRSYRSFHSLLHQYERRVHEFSERYGVDRTQLQLPPEELVTLLDPLALAALRDGDLAQLRDVSHRVFRSAEVHDRFDTHVTSIYHEVSLLKEEHWTVREHAGDGDRREYERYYREVNVYYPKRLRHVRNLYGKARRRLEQLLPSMSRSRVVVRSVYLFGDRLVEDVYEGGIEELYEHMYPGGGAVTGYALAGESFLEAGFGAEAAAAFSRAIDAATRTEAAIEDDGAVRELEQRRSELARRRDAALALT